jgi:phospholipid/cholesterol/gamma-HCH transport system ATP-binding protein
MAAPGPNHPRPGTPASGPLEVLVEDLHKAFGDHLVLRGVDLAIHRGDLVAIVGGSGCGKTVLIEHVFGQLRPDRGRVLVADHEAPGSPLVDLATLDSDQMDRLRVHWAIVFQRNALFSGTVHDNIALWLREVKQLDERQVDRAVRGALQAVGFEPDRVMPLDRDALSGGMAKRVAIARALAMDPLLLIYDEPTTGLDPQHAADIHDLICRTHRQTLENGEPRTTIIVTHDKDLLYRLQPRVVMLEHGKVFFDGSYLAFAESDSPVVRPYFDLMPGLQLRTSTE